MWRSKVHLSCLSSGYFDFTRHSFVWVVLDLDHLLLIPRLRCSLWVLLLGLFIICLPMALRSLPWVLPVSERDFYSVPGFDPFWSIIYLSRFETRTMWIPFWSVCGLFCPRSLYWLKFHPIRFIFNFIRIQSTIWTTLWICNPDLINLIEYFNWWSTDDLFLILFRVLLFFICSYCSILFDWFVDLIWFVQRYWRRLFIFLSIVV